MLCIYFLLTFDLFLFFTFYTSVAGLTVKVVNDMSSHVGGYYPLTIRVTPDKDIPEGGGMYFFDFKNYSTTSDCDELIKEITPSLSFSCSFSDKHLLLIVSSTRIEAEQQIKFVFKSLQYNTEMAPRKINIRTVSSSFNVIESQENQEWIPRHVAKFDSLSLSPTSTPMCRKFDLTFNGYAPVRIGYGSIVEWKFEPAFNLSSVSINDLNDIKINEDTITGVAIKSFNELSLTLKNIKAPSIPMNYNISMSTYSLHGHKVHEANFFFPISLDIFVQNGNIKIIGKKGVCETGQYELQITSLCQSIANAEYKIIPPVSIFGNQPLILSPGRELVDYDTLQFQLVNPCSIMSENFFYEEDFTVDVYNGYTNEEVFNFNTKLSSNTSYEHGMLKNFMIEPEYRGYGHECPYTFSMVNSNPIPLNGRIHLFLNPLVKFVGSKIATVNGVNTQLTWLNGLISILIPLEIPPLTKIKIIVGNFKNPYILNVYSGFYSYSLETRGLIIDKSSIASIYINEPGIATVEYTLSNSQNSAMSDYSFHLLSNGLQINNKDVIGIKMPAEIDPSTCDVDSITSGGTNQFSAKEFDFVLDVSTMNLDNSMNSVSFAITCQNPSTTALTNSLKFAVFRHNGFKVLKGEVKMRTTKGSYLAQGSSIYCDKTCPRCSSLCTLTLQRNTNTAFRTVVIINDRLDLTKLSCKYNEDGQSFLSSCLNANDGIETKIQLTISTRRETSVIVITNIGLIYPEYSTILRYPLKVRIYSSDTINPNALIEEDQAVVISGVCSYPCKTCSQGYNICDSCIDLPTHNEVYYLYPNSTQDCGTIKSTNCRELEDNKCCGRYYKDEVNHLCLQCNPACKSCEGTKDNCTECLDSSLLLSKGECKDKCDEGTYLDSSGKECQLCGNGCRRCDSSEECLECYTGYIFNEVKQCILKCPKGMYGDIKTCKSCDTNCAACITSPTKCTECNLLKAEKYLQSTTSKCVSKQTCKDGKHIANDTTNTCDPCAPDCEECKGIRTFCTKCSAEKVFDVEKGVCAFACPAYTYYKVGTEVDVGYCAPCENYCGLCISSTECITCITDKVLITDTKECKNLCPLNYYKSYRKCYPCNSLCASCDNASECTSCINNYYLYNGECYEGGCPLGTFNTKARFCEDCDPSCSSCKGTKYSCIECSPGYQMIHNKCIEFCSAGTVLIGDKCEPCDLPCLTCNGAPNHCTSCRNSDFLFRNTCSSKCPPGSTASLNSPNICLPCLTGCNECGWKNKESPIPELCTSCLPDFKYFNGKCYMTCFDGFIVSPDGHDCVSNTAATESSNIYTHWPFPHLIVAGLLAIVIILGQKNGSSVLITSNLIIALNIVIMFCYIFTIVSAFINWKLEILIVTGIIFLIQLILNMMFLVTYEKQITVDPMFNIYISNHSCFNVVLITFSTIFSFQIFRLLYSYFLGFEVLFIRFKDFNRLFKPLNCFSTIQLFAVQGPITIYNITCLIRLPYGNFYWICIIETLVLSFLLCALIACTIKNTEAIIAILEQSRAIIEERKFKDDEDRGESLQANNLSMYHYRGSAGNHFLGDNNPRLGEPMAFINQHNLVPVSYPPAPHPGDPSKNMLKYVNKVAGNEPEHQDENEQGVIPWIVDNNAAIILPSTMNRHRNKEEVKEVNIELDNVSISIPKKEETKSRSKVKGTKKERARTVERKWRVPLERIPEASEKDEESLYNSKLSCQGSLKDQREMMYMRHKKAADGNNPPPIV